MSNNGYITKLESVDGRTLYVKIHRRFDFGVQREFRVACHARRYARYVINLDGVEYIDSAALGMLMMLYRHAGESSNAVALIQCCEGILEILRIANFGQFFDIPGLAMPTIRNHDMALCFAG